uniref:Uncharacterized protein n=1 Tax=Macaca fascicularis TaxID=9541 RepID=Q9GMI8_MACFA|nr:hypothetical protein [Macaca fascicularis]
MLDVLLINVFPNCSIFLFEEWLQENENIFLLYVNVKSLTDQHSPRKNGNSFWRGFYNRLQNE